jgi:hypothetical protein
MCRAVGTKGSVSVLRCGNERWYQNSSESLWEGLPTQIQCRSVVPFVVALPHIALSPSMASRRHAIFALPDTMRPYRTALLLILCFALPCIAQAQTAHLTAAEAKNHVGETATVCGRVASIHFAEKAKGLPTFMNLDMPYPQQIFTIVIWGTDRLKFGNPERTYRNKNVCVSGKIISHRGIPEIIVNTPGQIQIQK